jgi:P-type conjugative transfer protein TrbJ
MKRFVAALLALVGIGEISSAYSQAIVFDPSNFVQNVIQVAHEAEQIEHQLQQLQNEAQMLLNQAQNLQHLDFNIVGRLQSNLATTERLLSQNQGMAFELTHAEQLFGNSTRCSTPPRHRAIRCRSMR